MRRWAARPLHGKCLYLKVDAGNLSATFLQLAARALAKFGESNMPGLTQVDSGGNQHTVNIHANLPLKFEQHVHRACIVCAPAQYPAATGKDCTRKRTHEMRWLVTADSLHLHRPRYVCCLSPVKL